MPYICTHMTNRTETAKPYMNLEYWKKCMPVTPNTLTSAFNYTSSYIPMFSCIYLCFTALYCTSLKCTKLDFTTLHYTVMVLTASRTNAICAIAL